MKDPLKYFILEGFGELYSVPSEDGLQIHYRSLNGYESFIPKFEQKDDLLFISILDVEYLVDDEFIDNYTTRLNSLEELKKKIETEAGIRANVLNYLEKNGILKQIEQS